MTDTENKCGRCSLCCKVMSIPILEKVDGQWCRHCTKPGCGIYAKRPEVCQTFLCVWRNGFGPEGESGPPELRPDKCHVVFATGTGEKAIAAYVDPAYPDAWRAPKIMDIICKLAVAGFKVLVGVKSNSPEKILFMSDKRNPGVVLKRTVMLSEADENGIQWYGKEKA